MSDQFAEVQEKIKENLKNVKHKILVFSGKGGVGKTTMSVNLAFGLAHRGYKTGILDVDIHGPNVGKMLGIESIPVQEDSQVIQPAQVSDNLNFVSLGLFMDQDSAVIWRGPLKFKAITQFLGDTVWGERDFLIIDAPPGTGDEPLSVCQTIPDIDGSVIITTPQEVSLLDTRRAVTFSRQVNTPVLGIIENMSGFVCPHCGGKVNIFKEGGGRNIALHTNVDFLGSVPLEAEIVAASDKGEPFVNQETAAAKAVNGILDKIIKKVESDNSPKS